MPSMSMAQSEDGLPPQRCCLCLMIMLMSYMHRMQRSLLPPCLQLHQPARSASTSPAPPYAHTLAMSSMPVQDPACDCASTSAG